MRIMKCLNQNIIAPAGNALYIVNLDRGCSGGDATINISLSVVFLSF